MLVLDHVSKVYRTDKGDVAALADLSLEVKTGEFLAITGPSGCGKTTLLMTSAAMLHPTSGSVQLDGKNIYGMDGAQRADFRGRYIGIVFQMFHLVPYLNVLENVQLGAPQNHNGRLEALELLGRLGLADRVSHRPAALSAGERQRTAIARALVKETKILLADEPTGNLDTANETQVLEILRDYHRGGGTVVIVTHGTVAERYADRMIRMSRGRIEEAASVT